jgi:hypothetical protein
MTEKLFIGIDPGLTGAVAVLDEGGAVVLLEDLPVMAAGSGGAKVKRRADPAGLFKLLQPYRDRATVALLEAIAARPGQGVASVFSLNCRRVLGVKRPCKGNANPDFRTNFGPYRLLLLPKLL